MGCAEPQHMSFFSKRAPRWGNGTRDPALYTLGLHARLMVQTVGCARSEKKSRHTAGTPTCKDLNSVHNTLTWNCPSQPTGERERLESSTPTNQTRSNTTYLNPQVMYTTCRKLTLLPHSWSQGNLFFFFKYKSKASLSNMCCIRVPVGWISSHDKKTNSCWVTLLLI